MPATRLNRQVLGLSALILTAASCTAQPFSQPPASQPPALQFVADHGHEFRQRADDPLKDVAPGTIRDDISGLSGCYGASYLADFLGIPFLGYEVYQFDAAAGEMRYYVMQAGSSLDWSAKFEVAGADRIMVTRTGGDAGTVAALITLDGDHMRIANVAQDGNTLDGEIGDPDDQRVKLVFRRFACPD